MTDKHDKDKAPAPFDRSDALSIYDYSRRLIGHSLRSLLGDDAVARERHGKGGLGQMVEELFFGYDINSCRDADFKDARLELKCTPLLQSVSDGSYRIKERLVCTMIDYFELVDTDFEKSHLIEKCGLMLLLFYLHVRGEQICDFKFMFRVLWQLPEKDLLLIKQDYETIAGKVRRGEAHLLSEGDTLYLGACRKGQKGDKPQAQPYSEVKASKRAFSLKPAYMRYILSHVVKRDDRCYSNYRAADKKTFELVSAEDLIHSSFEDILLKRFAPFIGMDYIQICDMLGMEPYQSKGKYADVSGLIASENRRKRISDAEEFVKSDIRVKTVRVQKNGRPREAMSFRNMDYCELYDNDSWVDSELYQLFTRRFLFVVFREVPERTITIRNNARDKEVTEAAYVLDKVFFWTMPAADIEIAREYWMDIRRNVLENNIKLSAFWSISDGRNFHVRPKATNAAQKTINPHGGLCDKYCYWFNADYVKRIIDESGERL